MDTLYTQDAYERISLFLSQYTTPVQGEERTLPQDCEMFKSAIKLLLDEKIFSGKMELKTECLHDFGIIIPDFLFPKSA